MDHIWVMNSFDGKRRGCRVAQLMGDSETKQLPSDAMQMCFLKRILRLRKNAINVTARGELGCLSMYVKAITQAVKY